MKDVIRFRPHHFLCSLGYEGKGYSDAFTENMTAIVVGKLRSNRGDDQKIEVVVQTDDICAPCPKRRGVLCTSQAKIEALDKRHAAALGLQDGDRLTWGQAKARIRDCVAPSDLDKICKGCKWLELGMCKAAVRALQSKEKAASA